MKNENAEERRRLSRERARRWRTKNPDGHRAYQQRWRIANRSKAREYAWRSKLKTKYGLTVEQWDELFAAQGNRCASCKRNETITVWHTDHCHSTGRVRGILCHGCNTSLGLMGEDAVRLRALAKYIKRALTKHGK